MDIKLLHVFRNTPIGRETLFQSFYFCKTLQIAPVVYLPVHTKFLFYFENDVVQVDLDSSYTTSPGLARERVQAIADMFDIKPRFLKPKNFTASTLPDIAPNYDFMCCPRSISDLSSKIGLGYIGPRVRRLIKSSRFPVLLTSPVFKKWKRLVVFFGGSVNSVKALKLGLSICRKTGMELDLFTQGGNKKKKAHYEKRIKKRGLEKDFETFVKNWIFFEEGNFKDNLYDVPHDALVIVGAYGHGVVKDAIFGSKLEIIQKTLANNFLIVGPNYITTR